MLRKGAEREANPTAAITDTQSAKTTEGGGPRGWDAVKQLKGRKRHVVVETDGLPRCRRYRLRRAAAPLSDREIARLVRPVAAALQRLRGAARGLRRDGHLGRNPPHAAPHPSSQSPTATRPMTSQSGSERCERGRPTAREAATVLFGGDGSGLTPASTMLAALRVAARRLSRHCRGAAKSERESRLAS